MRLFQVLLVLLVTLTVSASSQTGNRYEIYAIEYARVPSPIPIAQIAVGSTSTDSVTMSYYFWYLKGDNGRKILVDAGFIKDSSTARIAVTGYERPDSALRRITVDPDDITDLIITHAHVDHLDGIDLFPKATIWMQKNEFGYLVGPAWQKGATHIGLEKRDVQKIVKANLDGRLTFISGDSLEIIPGIRVFTGSTHTFESQDLLVETKTGKVLLASDDSWFYVNVEELRSIPLALDQKAYVRQLQRMRSLVSSVDAIVPGHDSLVLSRFPRVAAGVVKIR